jgi:hypothetical protein
MKICVSVKSVLTCLPGQVRDSDKMGHRIKGELDVINRKIDACFSPIFVIIV